MGHPVQDPEVRRALQAVWLRNTALQRASVRDAPLRTLPFSDAAQSAQTQWIKPYNMAGTEEACANLAHMHRAPKGKSTNKSTRRQNEPYSEVR